MTLHSDALGLLENWSAPNAEQATARDRYVAHLVAHPDGLDRACTPDHLTASTLVLSPDGRSVLLTLHAKAGRWFQFGGHCEPGDSTLAGAARREAIEESGLVLAVDPVPVQLSEHAVPFCGDTGKVHHLDVRFLAIAPADAVPSVSEESADVRWWSTSALPDAELLDLVTLGQARLTG